jgi:hypothetical protein
MRHPASMTSEERANYRGHFVSKREGVRQIDVEGATYYLSEGNGFFYAIAFVGKAIKPAFNYRFRTEARRAEYVADWLDGLKAKAESKKVRATARKEAKHGLLKGTILYSSWGYEQTNIDWYECVAVVSDKMVEIREIRSDRVDVADMVHRNTPCPGQYIGPVMRKRASEYGIRITSFSHARPWDGLPKQSTSYA